MPSDHCTERVTRGAALLDKHSPGWANKIDLSKLNIASHITCVLGQVFGMFYAGRLLLGLDYMSAYNNGFATFGPDPIEEAWKEAVRGRLLKRIQE